MHTNAWHAVLWCAFITHQASHPKTGRGSEMPEHVREVMDDQIIIVYKNAA